MNAENTHWGCVSVFFRLADKNETSKKEKGGKGDKLIFDRFLSNPAVYCNINVVQRPWGQFSLALRYINTLLAYLISLWPPSREHQCKYDDLCEYVCTQFIYLDATFKQKIEKHFCGFVTLSSLSSANRKHMFPFSWQVVCTTRLCKSGHNNKNTLSPTKEAQSK